MHLSVRICICIMYIHQTHGPSDVSNYGKTLQVVNIATISSVYIPAYRNQLLGEIVADTPSCASDAISFRSNSKCYIERPQMICVLPSMLRLKSTFVSGVFIVVVFISLFFPPLSFKL